MNKKIVAQLDEVLIRKTADKIIIDLSKLACNEKVRILDLFVYNKEVLSLHLSELSVNNRTFNVMKTLGLITVRDLVAVSVFDLYRSHGIGKKTFQDIMDIAAQLSEDGCIIEFDKAENVLSDLEKVILQEGNGVLVLDYSKMVYAEDLIIADIFSIPDEKQNISIKELKLTVKLKDIIVNELNYEIVGDLINHPLSLIVRRSSVGKKSLAKLLTELSKYSEEVVSVIVK